MEDQTLDLPNILQDLPDHVVDSSPMEEEQTAEDMTSATAENVVNGE